MQGVGYRWFVAEQARRLGVSGTVANRADGTVVVECSGEPTDVATLEQLLRVGPPGARVERLELLEPSGGALPGRFTIVR